MDLTRICLEDFSENFLELYTRHENILRSPTNLLKVQCWVLMGRRAGSEELHLSHTSAIPEQESVRIHWDILNLCAKFRLRPKGKINIK